MKIILYFLLLLVCLSCKKNADPSLALKKLDITTISNEQDTVQEILAEKEKPFREDTIHKSGLQTGENYAFYKTYLYHPDSSYVPEYTLDEVNKKFRILRVMLSKDSISINEKKSAYTVENRPGRKYFTRQYLYNFYSSAFKNGFNLDVTSSVTSLALEPLNVYEDPFIDYFMEGGEVVFMDDCLYLNYEQYIICLKKEKDIVEKNQKLCELPFDYIRYWEIVRLNNDDLALYYPEVTGFKQDQIERLIYRSLPSTIFSLWQNKQRRKEF